MFNRLGRKQSKLQIFPLFHTYPFKAENPPLQLLQCPGGSSGLTSFLLQPLKWSPDLTMAQGVNSPGSARAQHQVSQPLQGPGPQGDGWAVPALQNQHLLLKHLLVQKNQLPSAGISLERTEVTPDCDCSVLWGEQVVPCAVPDWKE